MHAIATRAFFVPARDGYRFCIEHRPANGAPRRAAVFVHGFAEEMNKSRRTVALAARALANAGFVTLQIDLHGCGDSSGDFGEATWDTWSTDVLGALDLVAREYAVPCWLWGLRAGTLLCARIASEKPDLDLLLWQPVISGQQHLNQFLRLAAASGIVGKTGRDSTQNLSSQLTDGKSVEVAGYALNPALAAGLSKAKLELPVGFKGRVVWLEVAGDANPELSLPAQTHVAKLRAAGIAVHAQAAAGRPFWQSLEIEESTALVDLTVHCLDA